MHFTVAISLSLNCLMLWRLVDGSSRDLILKDDISINDSVEPVSEKFFMHIKNAYIEKYNLGNFTIVGSFGDNLYGALDFGESYPHIVFAERKENLGNCVVIFLDGLASEIFVTTIKFSSRCTLCKLLFMFEKTEDGRLAIVGGIEGELVLVIAEKLNFTADLELPSTPKRLKYSRKASIVNQEVVLGEAEIGIGRFRPTNDIDKSFIFPAMYDDECIAWGVPRIMNWPHDQFSSFLWFSVGFTFVFGLSTAYIFKKVSLSMNGGRKKAEPIGILLDIVSAHFGSPVVDLPSTAGGRLMLTVFFYYATVVVTTDKTSLASILTTEKGTSVIFDEKGMLRENLSLGGSFYHFSILEDQINSSKATAKLFKRFVMNNNDSYTIKQLKFHNQRDFSFLAWGFSFHGEKYNSIKTLGSTTFDVFESCVLAYHTVMVTQEKSYLREPVNHVVRRLWEAEEEIPNQKNIDKFFNEGAWSKFNMIFLFHLCCIVFRVIIFLFLGLKSPKLIPKSSASC